MKFKFSEMYKNPKDALFRYVDSEDKMNLQDTIKLVDAALTNYLGSNQPLNYHSGKAIYVSETGLYSLINGSQNFKNKKELKQQIEKWIVDLRYGRNSKRV